MAAGNTIKNVIRGDTRQINCTLNANGNPVDITGWTAFFTVNANNDPITDAGAVIEKETTTHINPTEGETGFTLENSDTQNLVPGVYFYDIQFKDTDGNITSIPQAEFIVVADITRRIS
jgi:hypothetical protein